MDNAQAPVVAIDVGTHAIRAACFCSGVIGRIYEAPIALLDRGAGCIEQAPAELSQALIAVYEQASAGSHQCDVAITVQRSSVVAWQPETGEPLSPVISWQDTRGAGVVAGLSNHERARVIELSGLMPSAHYGATKLAVLAAQYPGGRVGPLGTWLCTQLLADPSAACSDPTLAARMQLWDLASGHWSEELGQLFDVRLDRLPLVRASVDQYGLLADGGDLRVLIGDQNAAFVYLSEVNKIDQCSRAVTFQQPAVVNIGSGAFVLTARPRAGYRLEGLLESDSYVAGSARRRLFEGTVNAAGAALDAWRLQHFPELPVSEVFARLEKALAAACTTSSENPCFYFSYSVGVGSPYWIDAAQMPQSDFVDAELRPIVPSALQQGVAIIESILFLLTANIERIVRAGMSIDGLIVSGGLSRNHTLVGQLANLCDLPALVVEDYEASLKGAAWLLMGDKAKSAQVSRGHYIKSATCDFGDPPAGRAGSEQRKRYQHYCDLLNSLMESEGHD